MSLRTTGPLGAAGTSGRGAGGPEDAAAPAGGASWRSGRSRSAACLPTVVLTAGLNLQPGSAPAQELAVDPATVEACFAGAAFEETEPACIGAAAGACQARPGGATTIGIVECVAAETAAWDAILNREYRAARAALDGPGGAGIDTGQALLEAQRAWIAFRDAECALTYALLQDGTIRSPAAAYCALEFTASRAIELRDMRGGGR